MICKSIVQNQLEDNYVKFKWNNFESSPSMIYAESNLNSNLFSIKMPNLIYSIGLQF